MHENNKEEKYFILSHRVVQWRKKNINVKITGMTLTGRINVVE